VSGTPAAGEALTCTPGAWAGNPTFAFAWLRNGAVVGAASQYLVTAADEGTVLQCRVTATNAGGSVAAYSAGIFVPVTAPPPVTPPAPPSNTVPPGLIGNAALGAMVACTPGAWSGSPTFSYIWLRNGQPIPGATGPTYAVTAADILTALQCLVTATNADGAVSALSVAAVVPAPAAPPVIPDFASFAGAPTSLRVSKTGRFSYAFVATPGRAGKASVTSTKSFKTGAKKRKLKAPSRSFTAPANGRVTVKFRLSAASRKALKTRMSVRFKVTVTVGSAAFSAKLKLKPPS
jgi:hypothetical protein